MSSGQCLNVAILTCSKLHFSEIGKRYVKWKRAVERSMKWETPVSELGKYFIL